MRINNPNNSDNHFYAGKCKGNAAPKHVTIDGQSKKVRLDKKSATMFDSPKSAKYIYIKCGEQWLWVEDKTIFQLDQLTTMAVTRTAKPIDEHNAPDSTEELPSHTGLTEAEAFNKAERNS